MADKVTGNKVRIPYSLNNTENVLFYIKDLPNNLGKKDEIILNVSLKDDKGKTVSTSTKKVDAAYQESYVDIPLPEDGSKFDLAANLEFSRWDDNSARRSMVGIDYVTEIQIKK